MRTLVLNMFLFVFILPFISGKVEKLKGTVKVGSKTFLCSFTLDYTGLKLDLKKSKAQCSPKLKKTVKNYTINGAEMVFTFTMTAKKGKITLSKVKIVEKTPPTPGPAPPTKASTTPAPPTTPSTAPAPSTKPPTTPGPFVPCAIGFTLVCSTVSPKAVDHMTEVCPAAEITGPAKNANPHLVTMRRDESCSCLPTRSVERDLESGISPLGIGQGCVKLEQELVFPNLKDNMAAMNLTQMATDWNISYIVSSLTSSGASKEHMEQALADAMMKTIHHELVFKSRGRISRFVRSTDYSDSIARNYMISQGLEAAAAQSTARQSNPGPNLFTEICKNLNAELLTDPKCETGCNATSPYRSISGCCNNVVNEDYGMANRAFTRLMPAEYANAISLPRGGLNPSTLPSPRNVSSAVHRVRETESKPAVSVMLMQFGQFLDHDITFTPEQDRDCCNSQVELDDLKMAEHLRFCLNIDTKKDKFLFGKTACLPFTRSDAICSDEETREQFNGITSYIDGSNVYGSDTATAQKLRGQTSGVMKTHELGPLMPSRAEAGFDSSHDENPNDLVGGDERAIEQPGLASMHSLFLNEHNRIAELLKEKADDEEVYNIARKLVGAEMQNIVYKEFLPVVLGNHTMEKYKLNLPNDIEGDTVYNSSVDPTIANEFATVAFRFGHSLIPNLLLPSKNPIRTSHISCPLHENFFQFDEFVIGADKSGKAWQNLLIGMQYQQSPAMDSSVSNNVLDFLYCTENCKLPNGFGQDLAARNIQRGRDHGLPSYSKFRTFCNLSNLTNWNSKPDDISDNNWQNLQKAYTNVDDIDPFTGGLSEAAVEDGLVGETFACILGLQFASLKDGDRFFFTHSANGNQSERGLPKKVKSAIRKRSLGDIICDNTEAISTPALVMQIDQNENETACATREGLTFSHIKELLSSTTTTTKTTTTTTKTTTLTTTTTTPPTTTTTDNMLTGCGSTWTQFGSHCYKYFEEKVTWYDAEARCVQEGGHLTSIHSADENQFLVTIYPPGSRVWSGGNDLDTEGTFVWTDGSAWDFEEWKAGEPNDFQHDNLYDIFTGGEDCTEIGSRGPTLWNDFPCDIERGGFVCKKK